MSSGPTFYFLMNLNQREEQMKGKRANGQLIFYLTTTFTRKTHGEQTNPHLTSERQCGPLIICPFDMHIYASQHQGQFLWGPPILDLELSAHFNVKHPHSCLNPIFFPFFPLSP